MKILRLIILLLISSIYLLVSTPTVYASSISPQPPFSEEGNPPEDYFFGDIFPLFGYIRAPALEVYENDNRTRSYVDVWTCPGKEHDRRDQKCNNAGDDCDGGDVDLCDRGTNNTAITKHSSNGSCVLDEKEDPNNPGAVISGHCEYKQRPRTRHEFSGTDYSDSDVTVYDKIQSKSGAYNNVGTDNAVTWGTQQLSLTFAEKVINQLLVVRRAKQTKATLRETGEWPLGWVDWGYTTPNGKTLLEINDGLPGDVAGKANAIVEGADDFFLNAGNADAVSDTSEDKAYVVEAVSKALSQNPPPTWATDLVQAPIYSPSWRQGYVRPSICVWDICCPGTRCIVPPPTGIRRGLYYDNSISQAFGASIDTLLAKYQPEEGGKVLSKIFIQNPLVRFAISAAPGATPSQIRTRLDGELKIPCLEYTKRISWLTWGTAMDYVNPGDFFDAEEKCPTWQIAPELDKQNAAAFYQSPLSALVALLWGQQQDQVDEVVYHLITVPDIMAQSIEEIQQPSYDTNDTLIELEAVKDFNHNLSNTVDDGEDYLYAGETPFTQPRMLGVYACDDTMFSSQLDTSIQAYALGTRIGCDQKPSATEGKCDGTKFAAIIGDSPWKAPTTAATQVVLNSEMFVDGKLNPKLEEVYAEVEEQTGVPCEVLAGHHFEEASAYFTDLGSPEKRSAANGGPVGEQGGFKATVEAAAHSVLRYPITNTSRLITSMSYFNGGGNANCQPGFPGGSIPYAGCPRQFIGEDDPYVTNMIDAKHNSMYLLYCGDFLPCSPPKPYGTDRPGAFAVALTVYNEATSKNSPVASPGSSASPLPSSPPGSISPGSSINPAGDCGDGYIDTALGCLPYERSEFIMALLRFLVGISGAISLVVMLMGTIQIQTSGGDPKKIQSGRDLFTAAIAGLLFLILSAAILRIVGFDILKLPGF